MDESARFVAVAQKFLTRDGLDVVASAASQREGLEKAIKLRPDVVLVDVTLGRESGFDVGRRLVEDVPDLHPYIVLTSTHDPEDFADLIAECPAVGLPEGPLSAGAVRELVDRSRIAFHRAHRRQQATPHVPVLIQSRRQQVS